MGIVSGLIGTGIKAAGSILADIQNARSARKVEGQIDAQEKRQQDWYNREYNGDYTQRSDALALLNQTEQSILKRNRNAAGAAAVSGATEESVAASKQANNEALASAVSAINANASARKDAVQSTFNDMQNNITAQRIQNEKEKMTNTAQAAGALDSVASTLIGLK